MKYKIFLSRRFTRERKRLENTYISLKEEVDKKVKILENNPLDPGLRAQIISRGGGIRKFRLSTGSFGKRGGFRICYVVKGEWVIVLTIYFKHQRENVLVEELKSALRDCLEEIKQTVS